MRLRAPAFGGLRQLDTGPDPLPGLVVVEGRNEAGKTTFFELVATALYGFYPASRESHHYTPWDGGVAEVQAVVELQDGGTQEVQRRLLSSPQGSLFLGSVEEPLRNRTLPCVEHVPRPVYRSVFALTLSELAGLEGESWTAAQDRLLDAMGATDLRSARQVAEELETEAGRLWRPNRRGTQEVRALEERLKQLRLRRREAADQEAEIRRLARELGEVGEELATAREEREACRVYVERYRALLPIRDQLLRVDGLKEDAGDPVLLEGLPSQPGTQLEEFRTRVRQADERLEELKEAARLPRDTVEEVHPADAGLLDAEEEIEALAARHAALEPTRVRAGQLEQELRDLERRLEAGARRLLDRNMDETLRDRILEVPVAALATAVRELDEARKGLAGLTNPRAEDVPPSEEAPIWLPLSVIVAGIAALLATIWVPGTTLPMVGTICLGAGIVLTYDWMRRRARVRSEAEARAAKREQLAKLIQEREEEFQAAADQLAQILDPLEPGEHAPDPGPDFSAQMERLQDLVRDESDRLRSLALAHREIEEVTKLGDPLRSLVAPEDRNADISTLAHLLGRALRAAMAREDAAAVAHRELERLERETVSARKESHAARERLDQLEARLVELGGGELERGIAEAEARLFALSRARQIMEDLRDAHPDLEEIHARIQAAEASGEDWAVDPEALAHRRAREETLTEEIEELSRRVQALEKDLEHLGSRTTLDELDGEILALEEESRRLLAARDRLWTLARVIREAERRLREEHQPDILKNAGRRLATLTGGRYDRILLAGRDGRSFRVRGPATSEARAIERPLSTGTREQIYLALRLSILDQIDRAGERLPLLLDELLVNWDEERREAGLQLLEDVSRGRQCFFFTCHPDMAASLEELGGQRIRLDGP